MRQKQRKNAVISDQSDLQTKVSLCAKLVFAVHFFSSHCVDQWLLGVNLMCVSIRIYMF